MPLRTSKPDIECTNTNLMDKSGALQRQKADIGAERNSHGKDAEVPFRAGFTLLPLRHNKIIHLVRHGQGFHNVAGENNPGDYCNEMYFDAHLTATGWKQAADLNSHITSKESKIRPEVVIVSPLMRAMQTAAAAFGGGLGQEGDEARPLMAEVSEQTGVSAAQPAIAAPAVPFVASELCREHIGVHPCDRRRPLRDYREGFPGIDFSGVADEDDVQWKAEIRESDKDLAKRGLSFLQWLSRRPETEIAVVSHSGFLRCMLSNFIDSGSDNVRNAMQRLFDSDALESSFDLLYAPECMERDVLAAQQIAS